MREADAPIKYAYDPESAESRFMQKHVFGRWRTLIELFSVAVMLLFLYFTVKIAMREYAPFFMELHPALINIAPLVFWSGIVLGLAAAYFCGLLASRLQDTVTDVEIEGALFNKGPIDVVLDNEGIHSTSPYFAQFVGWKTVERLIRTPQGIGLRLDHKNFIPVPETNLPDEEPVETLYRRIEAWYEAAK